MTKQQKKHMETTLKIFDKVRCLNPANEKRFMALPHSIMNYDSFTSLKPSSKLIYFYMTDYAVGQSNLGQHEFTFPRRIYNNIVCNETFKKSVQELIEHGFIDIVHNGALMQDETIYKFIDKWHDYKSPKKVKRANKITENKQAYLSKNKTDK